MPKTHDSTQKTLSGVRTQLVLVARHCLAAFSLATNLSSRLRFENWSRFGSEERIGQGNDFIRTLFFLKKEQVIPSEINRVKIAHNLFF